VRDPGKPRRSARAPTCQDAGMPIAPDHRRLVDAVRNRRPDRLPLYEHNISPAIIAQVQGHDLPLQPEAWMERYAAFWRDQGYDTVTWECGVPSVMPGHGAILGGRPGPIRDRATFAAYPWHEWPVRWWERHGPDLERLSRHMPAGMRAVGGLGYGVFETAEDLVGYEPLCLMLADDPELVADLFARIGDLYVLLWQQLLARFGDLFCVCRMGDDLGFKTGTLVSPAAIRRLVLPQYRRIVAVAHGAGKPFLLHSCGCIFPVMDEIIGCGIDAKHSNEDQIAPFDRWIADYGGRIGLLGGIDLDHLCRRPPSELTGFIAGEARRFRAATAGYALGSGNSIPDYVPVAGYLALIEAGRAVREAGD
jgi:hypothetical protein